MPRPLPWPTPGASGWNAIYEPNVDYAIQTADEAKALAQQNIASGIAGAVPLDSFAGATDDAKLAAANAYAKAQTRRPGILFPARDLVFSQTVQDYSGRKFFGPGWMGGWQNPEISGSNGSFPNNRVQLNVGTGASSWIVGNSDTAATTTYDTILSGFDFISNGGQCFHHPFGTGGTAYCSIFDNLTFYGFKHAIGMPNNACSITLGVMTGVFTNVAVLGEQYNWRGSDSWLVPASLNYGWAGANGGKYLVRFENLMKSFVTNHYLTARGGSRAILVAGPANTQGALSIRDCVIEGQNAGDPAMGALIRVTGGGVKFQDIAFNFGMFRPSDFTDKADTAYIMVDGGVAVFDTFWINRAVGVAETVPILETTSASAKAYVDKFLPMNGTWSPAQTWAGLPRVKQTAGLIVRDASVTLV